MARLLTIVLFPVFYSAVSAKFYLQELKPSSGNLNEVKQYWNAVDLLKNLPIADLNKKNVLRVNDDDDEVSEEIPIEWDSTEILRYKGEKHCYPKKHLTMICTNTCVGAIEYGCYYFKCLNKQAMKEYCPSQCGLQYHMFS